MIKRWLLFGGAAVALAACSGDGKRPDSGVPPVAGDARANASDALATDTSSADAEAPDAMTPDSGAMVMVPDPPMTVAVEWTDHEPNDTPGEATPVGIFGGALWMGFAQPVTMIERNDDVDFYVFRTGTDPMTFQGVTMQVCWSGGIDLLDMYLYEVVGGFMGRLLRSAETQNTSCETVLASTDNLLVANSVYLLEIRHAPNLALPNGMPLMYSA